MEDRQIPHSPAVLQRLFDVEPCSLEIRDAVRHRPVQKDRLVFGQIRLQLHFPTKYLPLEPQLVGLDLRKAFALPEQLLDQGPRRLMHHPETHFRQMPHHRSLARTRRASQHRPICLPHLASLLAHRSWLRHPFGQLGFHFGRALTSSFLVPTLRVECIPGRFASALHRFMAETKTKPLSPVPTTRIGTCSTSAHGSVELDAKTRAFR